MNLDGKRIFPGVRYARASNGYFLHFGSFHGTGGKVAWMPRHMLCRVGVDTSLFHVMWWSHKRGIHHHLRLGKHANKWWHFV